MNRTTSTSQAFSKTPFTRSSVALARRWFRRLRREPADLALSLLQPVIWLLLFGSLFTNVAGISYSYVTFMTAGVIVMTVFNGALGGGVELLFDRESGMLRRLIASPISPSSIIASRMIFVLLVAAGQSLVVLLVGALVGVSIASGALGILLILFTSLLLGIGILSASMALAFALRGHATFFQITGFISLPIIFASSALAPVPQMPAWLQGVARLNPLTYAIDGVRSLILQGINWVMLGSALVILAVFDVVMFVMASWVFSRALEA